MIDKPVFDIKDELTKSYRYDNEYYVIQKNNVFKQVESKGYIYTDEVSVVQLEIYGELLIEKPIILELKILRIKELTNAAALITGEDGSGLEIVFKDEKYKERMEKYKIGKINRYYIMADVLSCELPEDYAMEACLNEEAVSVYSETNDFKETGIYNFYCIVKEPAFAGFDETPVYNNEGLLICDGFKLVLPNQFNKANPIYLSAEIITGKFPSRIFQNLPEDNDVDFTCGGWSLKGTVRFSAYCGDEWWSDKYEDDEIIRFYGRNPDISNEEDENGF